MGNLALYGQALLDHWWLVVTGSAPLAIDQVAQLASKRWKQWADARGPWRRRLEIGFLLGAVVWAGFQAWQDEHVRVVDIDRKRQQAEQRASDWKARADERWHAIHDPGGYLERLATTEAKAKEVPKVAPAKPSGLDREIAVKMFALTLEGQKIDKAYWESGDTAALQKAYVDWGNKVVEYLTPIDPAYAFTFATAHGDRVLMAMGNHDTDGLTLYNMVLKKVDVLVQLMREMSAKGITAPHPKKGAASP